LSFITTASYASTREKRAMYQSVVFGLLVVVFIIVGYNFVIAFIGGAILAGTLAWLGIIMKNTNNTLGHDIPDR